MTHCLIFLAALGAAGVAAAVPEETFAQDRKESVPQSAPRPPAGGMLGTIQRGTWQCALPGDAGGEPYRVVVEEGFTIGTASSYHTPAGQGIYLLRGDELVFTRGPKKDQRYRRLGNNTLQKLGPGGSPSKLICTWLGTRG